MAESAVFDWACATLEATSGMTRMQSRGTMRLVLKRAGLEPATFNHRQLSVIAARILPTELQKRGVANAQRICAVLADCPESVVSANHASPDEIFDRLGRRR